MTLPLLELWVQDLRAQDDDPPNSRTPEIDPGAEITPPNTTPLSQEESALAARIRAGNRDAFTALFDRYYVPLCVFANRYVHDMESAREIVSEVLYQLWVRRETWTPNYSIATYCFGAVRHRVQNFVRDERTRARWTSRAATLADQPTNSAALTSPDVHADLRERARRLWSAVAELPDRQQLVITLRWQQGLSFEEIANIAGVSRAAAQMLADRAIKALRHQLQALQD